MVCTCHVGTRERAGPRRTAPSRYPMRRVVTVCALPLATEIDGDHSEAHRSYVLGLADAMLRRLKLGTTLMTAGLAAAVMRAARLTVGLTAGLSATLAGLAALGVSLPV